MRSLFFKIFVIFWIAQSLIFIISTALILQHRFPSPDVLMDSLFSSLRNEARESVAAFETGGCDSFNTYAAARGQTITLNDAAGRSVCAGMVDQTAESGNNTRSLDRIIGKQVGQQYVWSVPVTSATNNSYMFLLSRPHVPENHDWYNDLLHFAFPQLPVAIAIGGATTFVLVQIGRAHV